MFEVINVVEDYMLYESSSQLGFCSIKLLDSKLKPVNGNAIINHLTSDLVWVTQKVYSNIFLISKASFPGSTMTEDHVSNELL